MLSGNAADDGYVTCLAAMPLMMVGGNAADVVLSGNAADNGDVTCDNMFRLHDGNVACLAAMPLIDGQCYVLSGNATSAPWASEPSEAPRDAAANSAKTAPAQDRTSARAQAPQPSRSINPSSFSCRPLGWPILTPRAQTPSA